MTSRKISNSQQFLRVIEKNYQGQIPDLEHYVSTRPSNILMDAFLAFADSELLSNRDIFSTIQLLRTIDVELRKLNLLDNVYTAECDHLLKSMEESISSVRFSLFLYERAVLEIVKDTTFSETKQQLNERDETFSGHVDLVSEGVSASDIFGKFGFFSDIFFLGVSVWRNPTYFVQSKRERRIRIFIKLLEFVFTTIIVYVFYIFLVVLVLFFNSKTKFNIPIDSFKELIPDFVFRVLESAINQI